MIKAIENLQQRLLSNSSLTACRIRRLKVEHHLFFGISTEDPQKSHPQTKCTDAQLKCLDRHLNQYLVLLKTVTQRTDILSTTEFCMTENGPIEEFRNDG